MKKKTLSLPLIILLLLLITGAVVAPVSAQTATATPTITPTPGTPTPSPTPSPTPTEPPPPEIYLVGAGSSTTAGPYVTVTGTNFTCEEVNAYTLHCAGSVTVYDSQSVISGYYGNSSSISVSSNGQAVYWQITGASAPNGYDCVSPTGSCAGVTTNTNVAINLAFGMFSNTGVAYTGQATMSTEITISSEPIAASCAAQYTIPEEAEPVEIDPTVENPDAIALTVGQLYALELSGGPWQDPGTDRYDAAYSWDGVTWGEVEDLLVESECFEMGESGLITVYFTAEYETIYLRVDDTAEAFADNIVGAEYYYTLSEAYGTGSCAGQYSYDPETDWFASVSVVATVDEVSVLGAYSGKEFEIGEFYAIVPVTGSWTDNGGPPRYDTQFRFGLTGLTEADWQDVAADGGPMVDCVEENGLYTIAYVQAADTNMDMRVNDTGLNFTDNTGSVAVNIFHVTKDRYLDPCETRFRVGDWQQFNSVSAQQENGKILGYSTTAALGLGDLQAGGWYMLETMDGPWGFPANFHDVYSYDMDISTNSGVTFDPLDSWGAASCNVERDPLGHRNVYFQVPEDAGQVYYLRVGDTDSWWNNVGYMSWNLYEVVNLGNSQQGESCDFTYNPATPYYQATIYADTEGGSYAGSDPAMIPGESYAIVIEDTYAWQESSGGADLYDVEISDDKGVSWTNLLDYYGVYCYTQDGNILTVYLNAQQGAVYKLRVDSTSFSDNTGQVYFSIYATDEGNIVDPWTTCFDGVVMRVIDPFKWIPVKDEGGVGIGAWNVLVVGETYAIEILNGPWKTGSGIPSYLADLSDDGQETWSTLNYNNTMVTCAEVDQINRYWKGLFTVEEGDQWWVRVKDPYTGLFVDNTGNLAFKLYEVQGEDAGIPVLEGIPILTSPAFNYVCDGVCLRPTSILDVPAWLEYGRCELQQFIAWCPRHGDAMASLVDSFSAREPFATILEFRQMLTDVIAEAEGYNWDGSGFINSGLDSEGGDQAILGNILPSFTAQNNIWSGEINVVNFSSAEVSSGAYMEDCASAILDDAPKLGQGVCFVSFWARESGMSFWVQLLLDISVVVMFAVFAFSKVKQLLTIFA